ncbi:hypothetical protein Pmar_PMAR027044, partial [Perkinsus marinus ATCC 50983]
TTSPRHNLNFLKARPVAVVYSEVVYIWFVLFVITDILLHVLLLLLSTSSSHSKTFTQSQPVGPSKQLLTGALSNCIIRLCVSMSKKLL